MKRWLRLGAINGLALAFINIGSIIAAFGIYKMIGVGPQTMIQAPVAALLSLAGFLVWHFLVASMDDRRYSLSSAREGVGTCLLAFLWAPMLFVPTHFVTQGYLTSLGNIVGLWLFQLGANAAVLLTLGLLHDRRGVALS